MFQIWMWFLCLSLTSIYLPQGHAFTTDVSASFTDHSITPALDNDSFSGNLQPVEKPNAPTTYSPSDGWNCLCKGAQLEFMIRRGIYEANVPSAPKQPPGPLNTPSTFQDPKTDLAGWGAWSMTGSVIGSLATLLRNIGVSDVSKCSYWNANVFPPLFHFLRNRNLLSNQHSTNLRS